MDGTEQEELLEEVVMVLEQVWVYVRVAKRFPSGVDLVPVKRSQSNAD